VTEAKPNNTSWGTAARDRLWECLTALPFRRVCRSPPRKPARWPLRAGAASLLNGPRAYLMIMGADLPAALSLGTHIAILASRDWRRRRVAFSDKRRACNGGRDQMPVDAGQGGAVVEVVLDNLTADVTHGLVSVRQDRTGIAHLE